jgi:hypothetical protein
MSPKMRLEAIYVAATTHRPDSRRLRFSRAKVEKVVRPPQNPTVKSAFTDAEGAKRAKKPQKAPRRKHPAMFTKSVGQGKRA